MSSWFYLVYFSFRRQLRPKRLAVAVLLFILLIVVVAVVGAERSLSTRRFIQDIIEYPFGRFFLPVIALTFGTAVLGDEREDKTLVYLSTRPLPRWSLFLAKVLGSVPLVLVIALGTLLGICATATLVGGLPLPLPHQPERAADYLDRMDGLIITGGAFDVDPSLFGAETRHDSVILKERRTEFELAVTKGAIERDMPVLGICGGQQLLNVVLGGTLVQHIPDEVDGALEHEQTNPRTEPGNGITVTEGTLLHRIAGKTDMNVNSAHHQAVRDVAEGVIINAVASDGVIEGIEAAGKAFCLGVQWHPEYAIDPADSLIFDALISAAS